MTWNGSAPAGGSVVVTISTPINQAGVGQNISNQASFAYDRDLNGSNETTGPDDPTAGWRGRRDDLQRGHPVILTLSSLALMLLSLTMLGGRYAYSSPSGG